MLGIAPLDDNDLATNDTFYHANTPPITTPEDYDYREGGVSSSPGLKDQGGRSPSTLPVLIISGMASTEPFLLLWALAPVLFSYGSFLVLS